MAVIYIMNIELHNEDCHETLCRLQDGRVDLLLQDTPFGCTQNEWDIKPDLLKMWKEWERVTKENGAMIFFATQPFASELILSNAKNFRYDIIWYKVNGSGFLNAPKMPLRNHESILVFYRKLPTYNPQMAIGKMKDKGRRTGNVSKNYGKYKLTPKKETNEYFPESVISFSKGDNTTENSHPTQKPLDLIRYLVATYSNENDIVFDGYLGSGTTAEACVTLKRNFIGAELSKEYFEQTKKRIDIAKSQPQLF